MHLQSMSAGRLGPNQGRIRHVEATGQLLCGGPQYLKEILFNVKEILS